MMGLAIMLALSIGLLAQTPKANAATTSLSAAGQANGVINPVAAYHADPTCTKDSTAAINAALAAASSTAQKTVLLPAGCYLHNDFIKVANVALRCQDGAICELRATNELANARCSSSSLSGPSIVLAGCSSTAHLSLAPPGGIPTPITVSGVRGYFGCNPNGTHYISGFTPSTITYMPSGTCKGTGTGGNIVGKAPNSAIVMTGSGTAVQNITITNEWNGPRQAAWSSAAVLNEATNFVFSGNTMKPAPGSSYASASVGYQCAGCTHGTETGNHIANTIADGMYHTFGAAYITNSNNIAVSTGDDSFSVDSYTNDPGPSHDISFSADSSSNAVGRNFEVGGGYNISFSGVQANGVTGANPCVILTNGNGRWSLDNISNVTIDGLTGGNCKNGGISLIPTSSGATITGVKISNVTLKNTGLNGITLSQNSSAFNGISGVTISNVTMSGSGAIYANGVTISAASNVSVSNSTFSNYGGSCIANSYGSHAGTKNSGSLNLNKITCANNNLVDGGTKSIDLEQSGFHNINVKDIGTYEAPGHKLAYSLFVDKDSPCLSMSGLGNKLPVHSGKALGCGTKP